MGFEDRDYVRDGSYTGRAAGWGLDYIPPVVKWFIAINVIVFLLQIFVVRTLRPAEMLARWRELATESGLPKDAVDAVAPAELPDNFEDFEIPPELLAAWPDARTHVVEDWLIHKTSLVMRGQVWRLVTAAFCHSRASLTHILFNMLALYWFGVTLESMYGSREFLLFYLAAALVSGIATVALDLVLGKNIASLGASGAVMAVLMLYAIHYPRSTVLIFWCIPIEIRWLVVLYVLFDLHPVLLQLAGDTSYDCVNHMAHLGGLAFGYAYWRLGWNMEQLWNRITSNRARYSRPWRSYPRIARPSPEDEFQDQVDAILKKVHESGKESLTDRERNLLEQASQKYKRRRDS